MVAAERIHLQPKLLPLAAQWTFGEVSDTQTKRETAQEDLGSAVFCLNTHG